MQHQFQQLTIRVATVDARPGSLLSAVTDPTAASPCKESPSTRQTAHHRYHMKMHLIHQQGILSQQDRTDHAATSARLNARHGTVAARLSSNRNRKPGDVSRAFLRHMSGHCSNTARPKTRSEARQSTYCMTSGVFTNRPESPSIHGPTTANGRHS